MTMKTTQTYLKDHPIRIGLFVVLGVLALGVASAFLFGYTSPSSAEAQVVTTLTPVTVTGTTPVTTTTTATTVTSVITTVLTPIITTVTNLTGVTVTAQQNNHDTTNPGTATATTGSDGVTDVSGVVVTANQPDDSTEGETPSVTGSDGVTDVSGVEVVTPSIEPSTTGADGVTDVSGVEVVAPPLVLADNPFTLPCCTVPTPTVTTPTVVLPPIIVIPTVVPLVDICTNIPGLQNSIPDGMTQDSEGRCLPPLTEAPVCTLVANPSTVQLGGSSTLTWTTNHATSVSINNGVTSVALDGSTSVTPLFTTTYTLTATGAGGTVTCPTTVTVTLLPPPPPAPVCTLTATPVAVVTGDSSVLSWTTQNATSFSINQSIGAVTPVVGGTRSVTPAVTTTYTGTATGAGGTVHCTATVTVTNTPPPPAPVCTLVANPSTIQQGNTSTLTWTTQNATSFSINQGIGAVTPVSGGTRNVGPLVTTTYTGTATGAGGTVNCAATITVTELPPPPALVCTLTATPTAIQTGGSSVLSWTTENATTFVINQSIGNATPVSAGTRSVSPVVTTTYTGTASGPGGTVHCTATVTVTPVPPAPVCTLVANPVAVQLGGSSTLTWTTQNATTFSIDQGINTVIPTEGGSRLVTPSVTTTYTGTATGAGGTAHCTASVTVTSNPPPTPPICTLVANPSAIQTGGTSSLTWTTQHATTFTIDQGINAVTPVSGGTQSVTPANTTTYTGTATGPGGTTTCTATVTVTPTPPPAQCVLTASPSSVTKGSTSTLSWSGTNIASVIIDQGIGAKGPTGTVNVTPDSTTTYTGTFTSTTGQTLSCAATVTVTNTEGVCTSNCGGGGGGHRNPRVVLSSLKTPTDQPLAFVYLSQIPYTGLDLGPLGTALYWLMLVLWSLAAAYLVFFNVLPVAYRKLGNFGGSVKDVLGQPAVVHAVHTPEPHAPVHAPAFAPANVRSAGHAPVAHHEPAHHAEVEAPQQYQEHEGFRSYATGSALTIEDIVKGLAREAEARPTASAHEIRPDFMIASVETSAPAPVYPTHEESREEVPVAVAQVATHTAPVAVAIAPFNEDVRHFIQALLHGDRDTVFGTIRGITRTGGDSEAFLTHAVCALDDAYRSRMDGSVCHPDILSVTADCHPSFLERVVTSLTTAVDGSYSTGITGVKLALTRALAVVNG